jgi:flagellar hook-associated protein 2
MVTQINLGNFGTIGGKNVVTGGQSGFDVEGLVKGLTEARRLPAAQLEDKIELNDAKTSELNKLRDILNRFRDAAELLRNPPGVGKAASNAFAYRSTSLTSTVGLASDYMTVIAKPGTAVQNFTINEIGQLAQETKQDTGSFFLASTSSGAAVSAAPTAGLFTAGTVELRNVTGGANVSVTLNDGDTLSTVANRFNAVKDRTGIQATIIKVADGDPNDEFKLVFTATQTGETYGFDLEDPGTVINDPSGVMSQMVFTTQQTAQNAEFTIDNVAVERETNGISDVIDGLTFTLKQPTGAAVLGLSIQPDQELAKSAVLSFVDAYNEFRLFAAKQSEVGDDGLPTETAILNNSSTLRAIVNEIGAEISGVVGGILGGDPDKLADIGLTLTDFAGDEENPFTRNILTINEEALTSAIASNYDGVAALFEYRLRSDNENLSTFSRTNALGVDAFTLNVDITNGVYEATYLDADNNPHTIALTGTAIPGGGVSLKGVAGTVLEGLTLIYSSPADATINVTISQGIGDRLYNALEKTVNTTTGTVTRELESIEDSNTRFGEEITRIDVQVERYRETLLDKFSTLEAALARSNQLLQLLDAQAQAREAQ